jgi:hypothetical protein
MSEAIEEAMRLGYRMVDLTYKHQNEYDGSLLAVRRDTDTYQSTDTASFFFSSFASLLSVPPLHSEVFLVSKIRLFLARVLPN